MVFNVPIFLNIKAVKTQNPLIKVVAKTKPWAAGQSFPQ